MVARRVAKPARPQVDLGLYIVARVYESAALQVRDAFAITLRG